jgi:hypothetical protein
MPSFWSARTLSPHRDRFEENFRKVIERTIEMGVVPVLATRADNLEGDDSINETSRSGGGEYDCRCGISGWQVQPLQIRPAGPTARTSPGVEPL